MLWNPRGLVVSARPRAHQLHFFAMTPYTCRSLTFRHWVNSLKKQTIREIIASVFPSGTNAVSLFDATDQAQKDINQFPLWPPDLFACMAILAERAGAYALIQPTDASFTQKARHAEAIGEIWLQDYLAPDLPAQKRSAHLSEETFNELCDAYRYIDEAWRALLKEHGREEISSARRDDGTIADWCVSIILLLIVADQASADIGLPLGNLSRADGEYETEPLLWAQAVFQKFLMDEQAPGIFLSEATARQIWSGYEARDGTRVFETLTINVDATQASVLPKMRTPQLGTTLRTFSHYLALLPGSQEVKTTWYSPESAQFGMRNYNLLAIPYPYDIRAEAFIRNERERYDRGTWGEFHLDQHWIRDLSNGGSAQPQDVFASFVGDLLAAAQARISCKIHGIVLPEAAISPSLFKTLVERIRLEPAFEAVEFLVAGVSGEAQDFQKELDIQAVPPKSKMMNTVGIACFSQFAGEEDRERRDVAVFIQPKHHRWKLDRAQLETYDLDIRLAGSDAWWENCSTDLRHLQFVPLRCEGAMVTLLCEDLARIDPCQTVVRSVGPNMVIALLLDGPQLGTRWPARYATVLADDPGCSVFSLTSLGLMKRTCRRRPDANMTTVGLWRDSETGTTEIKLSSPNQAVVLAIEGHSREEFTLDSRSDCGAAVVFRLNRTVEVGLPEKGLAGAMQNNPPANAHPEGSETDRPA